MLEPQMRLPARVLDIYDARNALVHGGGLGLTS